MSNAFQVKARLLEALSEGSDSALNSMQFQRKPGSLIYSRTLGVAKQEINLVTEYFPKYQPDAQAHIHPTVSLAMPAVSQCALDLVKGDKTLLASAPDVIFIQPAEFSAPKDEHTRWFARGDDFVAVCGSITSFLLEWVVPLLGEIAAPRDLVRLYETGG
jgi:hypothetical protein